MSIKVKVKSYVKLSNPAYHATRKPSWKLIFRGFGTVTPTEIPIPAIRGDDFFEAEMLLAPGYYTLETGKNSKIARQKFMVTRDGHVIMIDENDEPRVA